MAKETKIVAIFVGIVLFQIGWHWFLTWHTNASEVAMRTYLLHNPHSRKGVAGYLDIIIPAVFIGLLLGRIGWQWPSWKLVCFVLLFAGVLVALRALYAQIITLEQAWWWPKSDSDSILFFVGQGA